MKLLYCCGLLCSAVISVWAQERSVTERLIHAPELQYSLEKTKATLDEMETADDSDSLFTQALLLYRYAILTQEIEHADNAYQHLTSLVHRGGVFSSPVVLLYQGSAQTILAGVTEDIPSQTALLYDGLDIMEQAREKIEKTDDLLALSYYYFLRANTVVKTPDFLGLQEETTKLLSQALKGLKKLKGGAQYSDLIANIYFVYADYYMAVGRARLAIKSLQQAEKFASSSGTKRDLLMKKRELGL